MATKRTLHKSRMDNQHGERFRKTRRWPESGNAQRINENGSKKIPN